MFRKAIEKLKKAGKFTPLVDYHSVQASGTFSVVVVSVDDDDDSDGNSAAKPAGKK